MNIGSQWKPVITLAAVNFGFAGVNLLLKKIIDDGTKHLVIITYRQSISAIFLAPIAYFWERKSRPKLTFRILCYIFFSALIGATLTQYLFLLGLQYTSATFSCAFINMVPVFTFLMALPCGLEKADLTSKAGKAKVLGTLVCIGGAMLLTLYKGLPLTNPHSQTSINQPNMIAPKKTENWAVGATLLTAGSLLWSSWFLIQVRISKRYPCQYSSTAILSFFSAIQSTILCWMIEQNVSVWVLKGKLEILSVIYSGMVGSGLCYVGMAWCVKEKGPVYAAAFTPLVQIFVAMFDFSILHEQIYLGSAVGSIVVVAGLYFLLWGKRKDADNGSLKQPQLCQETEECHQATDVLPISINSNHH